MCQTKALFATAAQTAAYQHDIMRGILQDDRLDPIRFSALFQGLDIYNHILIAAQH